jgi:hypothetical protein
MFIHTSRWEGPSYSRVTDIHAYTHTYTHTHNKCSYIQAGGRGRRTAEWMCKLNATIDLATEQIIEENDNSESLFKGLSLDLQLLLAIMRMNERRTFTTLTRSIFMFEMAGKAHTGVFGLPFLLTHDCAANCRWFFLGDMMFVQAIETIPAGDALTRQFVPTLQEFNLLPDKYLFRGDPKEVNPLDKDSVANKLLAVKPKSSRKQPKPKPRKISTDSLLTRYHGFECHCVFHDAVRSNATAWEQMKKMLCDAVDMQMDHNLNPHWEFLGNYMENITKSFAEICGNQNPVQYRYLNVLADAAQKTAHWNEGLFLRLEAMKVCDLNSRFAWMFAPDPLMRVCQLMNERVWLVKRHRTTMSLGNLKTDFDATKKLLLQYCMGSEELAQRMYPVACPDHEGEKLMW